MNRFLAWSVPFVAVSLVVAGCSSDKSSSTEATSSAGAATSASSAAAAAPDPLAEQAAAEYKTYAVGQIDELAAAVKVLTDAVRANDLQAAQDAYAPSRVPWERI